MSKQLTQIYYGKTKTVYENAKQTYINDYLNENQEELIHAFNNFSLDDVKSRQTASQSRINSKRLENIIRQAEQSLSNYKSLCNSLAPSMGGTIEFQKAQDTLNKIEKIISQGRMLIQTSVSKGIVGEQYTEAAAVVNKLKAFVDFHIANGSKAQATGDFFEKALASFAQEIVDANSDLVFDEIKKNLKAQLGQVPIKRGNFAAMDINATVSIEEALKIAGVDDASKLNTQRYRQNADGTITIVYTFNPSSPKQGKMDVLMGYKDYRGNPVDVRASAKHWFKGSGDLGETSIAAGLARQGGQGLFYDYMLAVLTPSLDQLGNKNEIPSYQAAIAAHKYAKLALKADIAMGLNQGIDNNSKAGYANLLIIDRGDSIVVKNLSTIALAALLEKYDNASIQSSAISIYNKMKNIQFNRTEYYIQQMIPVLDKMKVTIKVKTVRTNV